MKTRHCSIYKHLYLLHKRDETRKIWLKANDGGGDCFITFFFLCPEEKKIHRNNNFPTKILPNRIVFLLADEKNTIYFSKWPKRIELSLFVYSGCHFICCAEFSLFPTFILNIFTILLYPIKKKVDICLSFEKCFEIPYFRLSLFEFEWKTKWFMTKSYNFILMNFAILWHFQCECSTYRSKLDRWLTKRKRLILHLAKKPYNVLDFAYNLWGGWIAWRNLFIVQRGRERTGFLVCWEYVWW